MDPNGFIAPPGNGTVVPPPPGTLLPGRFIKSTSSPQVWWEDPSGTVKREVYACTPCPGVDACGTVVTVPEGTIEALEVRAVAGGGMGERV